MKSSPKLTDDTRYRLLRILEDSPALSQRELARRMGLSLGKTNYCLNAIIEKGWVKARNFKNSRNKAAYMYILTPRGIAAKARITRRFLQRKLEEYELLRAEIERLRAEVGQQSLKAPTEPKTTPNPPLRQRKAKATGLTG